MAITLFIVSLLTLGYFLVAKGVNKVSTQSLSDWQSAGSRSNKPNVLFLPTHPAIGIISGIIMTISLFFWLFIVSVGPQEVAVVKTPSGVQDKPLYSGWRLVLPWYDTYPMDITQWVYTFSNNKKEGNKADEDAIWAPTSEGIKMGFDMSISWRIDPKYAPWIYQNISEADGSPDGRYKWIEENIIRAKTKSIAALTISKYTPLQCYTSGRVQIQSEIKKSLARELSVMHFILEEVNIREVFYDPNFEKELKNTKIEEQKAKTMIEVTKQNGELLVQERIKKDIAIEQAKGEAEALRIKGNAITTNPNIIKLNWIDKWNGELPNYMLGDGQGIMMNIQK